jgi:hypothetical protein
MEKYKYYGSHKLKNILDENKLNDIKTENFLRSILLSRYKKENEVNNVSVIDDEASADFSRNGCDCCSNGLGSDVYEAHGYSSKHKKIFELGSICHECICVEYNGID